MFDNERFKRLNLLFNFQCIYLQYDNKQILVVE